MFTAILIGFGIPLGWRWRGRHLDRSGTAGLILDSVTMVLCTVPRAIARAYGIEGETVLAGEDVRSALSNALEHSCPYLADFRIEREEAVFPMALPARRSMR